MNQALKISQTIRRVRHWQKAFTLIELMIAMTIGLVLLGALLAVFVNQSRANREMAKMNMLIENGRFAIQLLENDLVHAGYWGELDYTSENATFARLGGADLIPDPCLAVASWTSEYKKTLLAIPVQGYTDETGLSGCGVAGVLTTSDVLLVRRANTCLYGAAGCEDSADRGPHIQISNCHSETSPDPAPYVIEPTGTNPLPATFPLRKKNCPTPTPPTTIQTPLRKVVSNIYYLATNNGQPTFMRRSLVNGVYVAQPLLEGIEYFRVEYGIDENGRNGLPISNTNPGDGSADRFITTAELAAAPVNPDTDSACDIAGSRCFLLANTVAIRIRILARALEPTPGYQDTKIYPGMTTAAKNDNFKRHAFSRTIRLVNPSGRRETP